MDPNYTIKLNRRKHELLTKRINPVHKNEYYIEYDTDIYKHQVCADVTDRHYYGTTDCNLKLIGHSTKRHNRNKQYIIPETIAFNMI